MGGDIRAFLAGLAVFVALYVLHWWALAVGADLGRAGLAVVGFGYAIPVIAGGVTMYLSGPRQFTALLALGVVGSGLVAAINFVASSLGVASDLPSAGGIVIVAVLSLLVQIPLVLVGGALVGLWLRSRHANHALNRTRAHAASRPCTSVGASRLTWFR